jgi:YceI-like domain
MKKSALICLTLLFFTSLVAQDKKITRTGQVSFEASVPAFEEVKADHKNVTAALNNKTGEIQTLILIKGFRFKVALMEEHFNENYIESDKFPKATFKGKIEGYDYGKLSATGQDFSIKGTIEMHGKAKDISITAKIKKGKEGIELVSNFILNADDFDINIPSIVSKKVSKKVNVQLNFNLK